MKIYIVQGYTGEYEDRMEWIAKIFANESEALFFKDSCEEYAKYMMEPVEDNTSFVRPVPRYYTQEYNSPDPYFRIDYTGTWYTIEEFEVEE